eukprot:scaffold2257_cov291-Prasinococcus_capsulatus_cf.AAC.3
MRHPPHRAGRYACGHSRTDRGRRGVDRLRGDGELALDGVGDEGAHAGEDLWQAEAPARARQRRLRGGHVVGVRPAVVLVEHLAQPRADRTRLMVSPFAAEALACGGGCCCRCRR